ALHDARRISPDVTIQCGDGHQVLFEIFGNARPVGFDTHRAMLVECQAGVTQQLDAFEHVVNHDRLVYVQLEITLGTGKGHRGVVAKHLYTHHGERFTLRGIDLARHNRRTGFVIGNDELADAASWAT